MIKNMSFSVRHDKAAVKHFIRVDLSSFIINKVKSSYVGANQFGHKIILNRLLDFSQYY